MGLAAFNRMRREQAEKAAEKKVAPDTVEELKEALIASGVEFPANAKKADLQKLYQEAVVKSE